MKKSILMIVVILFCSTKVLLSQTTEDEALKKLVGLETETFIKGDLANWKSLYVQDEKTNKTYVQNGYWSSVLGWDSISSVMTARLKARTKPSLYTDVQQTNYIIHVADQQASLMYDQKRSAPGNDTLPTYITREFRTLSKVNNQWKINSTITIDTLSFTSTRPEFIEELFNATGYSFLRDKKLKEAIEVFKFNVKMYPKAWNTYDSLGEAYAALGDKKLAIENYEKSIKLNPENTNGIEIVKKLKGK